MRACLRHDLSAIRDIFDRGNASPYDIDEMGRNLLDYVAVGVQVSSMFLVLDFLTYRSSSTPTKATKRIFKNELRS